MKKYQKKLQTPIIFKHIDPKGLKNLARGIIDMCLKDIRWQGSNTTDACPSSYDKRSALAFMAGYGIYAEWRDIICEAAGVCADILEEQANKIENSNTISTRN